MTLARQLRLFCLAVAFLASGKSPADEPLFGTSEQISINALTGLAIEGFDPVAYFAARRARPGKPDFETVWRGATWRFANGANRDAFVAYPEIFAPAFGGYDAAAIARGAIAAPDPAIFAIIENRLYLFRSLASRESFQDEAIRRSAEAAWTRIEPRLLR